MSDELHGPEEPAQRTLDPRLGLSENRRRALGVASQTRRLVGPMFRKTTAPTMTATQTSGPSGLTAQRIQTAALQSVRLVCGVFATALMLAQPVSPAAAQVSELRPGAYVRIRAPGVLTGEVECTILARDRDTLRVARPGSAPIAVPLASITRAAVHRGRTRGAGARKGAKWGAGVGLGLGLFNIGFSGCSGTHCETSDNVAGVAAFTAIGAGVGALVGTVVRAERWERVELPPRVAGPAVATTVQWPLPR